MKNFIILSLTIFSLILFPLVLPIQDAIADNTVLKIIKLTGSLIGTEEDEDFLLPESLTNLNKTITFMTVRHLGDGNAKEIYRSWDFVNNTAIRFHGSSNFPANNAPMDFVSYYIEFTAGSDMIVQNGTLIVDGGDVNQEFIATLSPSVNATNSFFTFDGLTMDHADLSWGSEEFGIMRVKNDTSWGYEPLDAPNSGDTQVRFSVIDWNNSNFIIQNGTGALQDLDLIDTIVPSPAIDRRHTIVLITPAFNGELDATSDEYGVTGRINSSNEIEIEREDADCGGGSNCIVNYRWELISFPTTFANVTHDQIFKTTTTGSDVTVSTIDIFSPALGNASRSIAIGTNHNPMGLGQARDSSGSTGTWDRNAYTIELINATAVNGTANDARNSATVPYQVIEFLEPAGQVFNQDILDVVTVVDQGTQFIVNNTLFDIVTVNAGIGSACNSAIGTSFRVGCYTFDSVDISNDTDTNQGTKGSLADAEYFSDGIKSPFVINATGRIGQAVIQNGTASGDTQGEIRLTNSTNISEFNFVHSLVGSNLTSINFWLLGDVDGSPEYPLITSFSTNAGEDTGISFHTRGADMCLQMAHNGTFTFNNTCETTTGIPADDGQWHMVTLLMDKGNVTSTAKICVDGSSNCATLNRIASWTTDVLESDRELKIGGQEFASSFVETTWNVDDFAIWHGYQLTNADIDELFVEGVSEIVALQVSGTFNATATDTATATDDLVLDITKLNTDTITTSDLVILNFTSGIQNITTTDTTTVTDQLQLNITKILSDTTTVLDQVDSSLDSITNQTSSDIVTVVDQLQITITKILTETATTSDNVITNRTGIFNQTVTEIVVVNDNVITSLTSIFNETSIDTATVTDLVVTMLTSNKELLDIISASDSIIVTFNTTIITPPSGGGGGGSTSPSNFQRIQGLQIQSEEFQVMVSDTIPSEFVITWFGQETVGVSVTDIDPDPDFDTWFIIQPLPQDLDNAVRIDNLKLSLDPTRITNVALQPYVLNVPTIMCNITLDPNVPCFDPILYQIPVDFTFNKGGFPFETEHIVTVDGRSIVGACVVFGANTIVVVCDTINFLEENWWWLASIAFVLMIVSIIWKRGGTNLRVVRRISDRDLQSMSGEKIRRRKKFKKR